MQQSKAQVTKNFWLGSWNLYYEAELPGLADQRKAYHLSWSIFHEVLGKDVRRLNLLTNLKGISPNNILLNEERLQSQDKRDLLFDLHGRAPRLADDGSEVEEDFRLAVETKFSNFFRLKDIQYQPIIINEGEGVGKITTAIPLPDEKTHIKKLVLGMEFFAPHLFFFIGFAPRICRTVFVCADHKSTLIKIKCEDTKKPAEEFLSLGDYGRQLSKAIHEAFSFDLNADFAEKVEFAKRNR